MSSKLSLLVLGLIVFSGYFAFWWLYRLDVLPGLHGDEAWAGLKAQDYRLLGIDRLSGMTYYTGILQTLISAVSFKFFHLGVFQLRLPGAFFNLMSLVIIIFCFFRHRAYREAMLFLLLVASSASFLISARIAWEVNSLTLFFLASSLLSLNELYRKSQRSNFLWVCLFFTVNILGAYNHIIYSCISISTFFGVALWSSYYRSTNFKDLLALLIINVINVCVLFLIIKYHLEFVFEHILWLPAFFITYIAIQYQCYLYLSRTSVDYTKLISQLAIRYLLTLGVLCFSYFHGKAFFEVISTYQVVLQFYSYESSLIFQICFFLCAVTILVYAARCILADLKDPKTAVPPFVILSYVGLFSLYTQKCSFRYYLAIIAILFIYLGYSLIKKKFNLKPFLISQVILLILLNTQLLDIFINHPLPVRATNFKIGNNQDETSAHFLPKEPLIDYLKRNNISNIDYLTDPYFLNYPVRFYKLIRPWEELPNNSATVDYDYLRYKNGFYLFKYN